MTIVIDSSVVLKWYLDEEGKERALNILADILDRKISVILPKIIFFEVGNVLLYKKSYSEERVEKFRIILEKTLLNMYDFNFDDWDKIIKYLYLILVKNLIFLH